MSSRWYISGRTSFLFLTLALLIFGPADADHGKLSAAEMADVLISNTVSGKNERGTDVHVYHAQDGTMKGMARNGRFHDSGTWETSADGQYCRQWNKWRDSKRDCFYLLHLEDNVYQFEAIDTIYKSRVKLYKGDPKKLN